jgi:hypothetical protein
MRILLVLSTTEHVRVTRARPEVPKRAMLWLSVLSSAMRPAAPQSVFLQRADLQRAWSLVEIRA